jgi:hypothetical protein
MTIGAALAQLIAQELENLRSQFATSNVGFATDPGPPPHRK